MKNLGQKGLLELAACAELGQSSRSGFDTQAT